MSEPPKLTDREALERHRARGLAMDADKLHQIATIEIEERLQDINKSFTKPVIVGHAPSPLLECFPDAMVVDDDERLALEPASQDLVIHAFGLHWANDPIGQMVQSRLALQPDGLFVGVLFGGQTLVELRSVLAETESALSGGISPRVAPLADVRTMGDLLVRAGFALPVADSLRVERLFSSIQELAQLLRALGETNALDARLRRPSKRSFWDEAERRYREHFTGTDGALTATFEMLFVTGWAPHESQQKPLRPGTATQRLADALGVPELDSGDAVHKSKR